MPEASMLAPTTTKVVREALEAVAIKGRGLAAIEEDRALGLLPFLVVGTAGTVNTGAIDPMLGIAEIAAAENPLFHVDGAIGALAMLSSEMRGLFAGIELSASVALDFHRRATCTTMPAFHWFATAPPTREHLPSRQPTCSARTGAGRGRDLAV